MRKVCFLFLLFYLFTTAIVIADSDWDSFSGIEHAWDGQKSITNKEFEEAIGTLEEKSKKKEAKQRKKMIKKIGGGGSSLHSELSPDAEIKSLTPINKEESGLLLNVPVDLLIDGETLEKGFYKIISEKNDKGEIYLLFYQSQFFKGKIKAIETKDDFNQEFVDFVDLVPYNHNFVKIIFGSMEYNAYAYVKVI